jgi:glycoside/pentoside/hexuronide:cation symporter, GPH family
VQNTILIGQTAIGAFASTFVAAWVSKLYGKKYASIGLMAFSVFLGAVPMTLRLLNLFPPNGSNMLVPALLVIGAFSSTTGIAASILNSSMIADIVEDSELRTGKRSEGLFFSAAAFVNKAVSGAGILSAGLILGIINFPVGASPDQVGAPVLRNLALLYIPTTVGLYAIAIAFLCFYGISRADHEANLRKLAAGEVADAEGLDEAGSESLPKTGRLG